MLPATDDACGRSLYYWVDNKHQTSVIHFKSITPTVIGLPSTTHHHACELSKTIRFTHIADLARFFLPLVMAGGGEGRKCGTGKVMYTIRPYSALHVGCSGEKI